MSFQQQYDEFESNNSYKKIAVVSGGTAANSLVSMFSSLSPNISYILPISDNGGSTSEIIRVIGGPAIGDLRSRITRLIPEESKPLQAILSYRLSEDSQVAKAEWAEIVEGTHPLWYQVQPECKELIRPFFVHVHVELLKRSRPGREFRFDKANVGNLFLTGARLFCGALDPAIELFLRVTLVPSTISVLPALNTNFSHHISAQLENGVIITGQSQISHPSNHLTPVNNIPHGGSMFQDMSSFSEDHDMHLSGGSPSHNLQAADSFVSVASLASKSRPQFLRENSYSHLKNSLPTLSISSPHNKSSSDISSINTNPHSPDNDQEDAYLPFSHPDLRISQLHFHKGPTAPLISPIRRIYYINPYGQEIQPRASSRVIRTLEESDVLIYSIGSLFTSTIPVIILQGFASAIQDHMNSKKKKMLLLNGSKDRETETLSCLGFIRALIGACLYSELGNKGGIYNNPNLSSSSIGVNAMNNYKHRSPHEYAVTSNYATTSAHPQDILMRPTPRLAKNYSTGVPSHLNISMTAEYGEKNEHEENFSTHLPSHSADSPASNISNAWVASDSDIEDTYNPEKINHAVWSKYITHIVYLNDSPLCPTRKELEELHARGIRCYGVPSVSYESNGQKMPVYQEDLLKKIMLEIIYS